jgi:dTDP-glucose 4,6-dehydratase
MRVAITGAAGFLASHLTDRFLADGHSVVGVDNLLTGRAANVAHLAREPRFELVEADVSAGMPDVGEVDGVLHLASPASPVDYYAYPLETLAVGSDGTRNALALAERSMRAGRPGRFLLASTSEVYGDPHVHPQPESYWGHVNPIGARSCYDEAKRFAEALTMAYHRARGVDTRIVRIFNTYGPRMRPDDGRVVSNFAVQALRGEPLTVYGEGRQTRSFTYVDDLVDGILRLLYRPRTAPAPGGDVAESALPTNVGSDVEFTVRELADLVRALADSASPIDRRPTPADDPRQRRPDLTRARATLGWEPLVPLREGLAHTLAYFRERLAEDAGAGARTLEEAVPAGT